MNDSFKDYYRALQLPFGADAAEIKTAYRRLAMEQHPDKHPEETERYTTLFQQITEAYETLSDPEKKTVYDFRYRQVVLGQAPQYAFPQYEYYEDDTPPNTREYKHTYTKHRPERSIPFVRIAVGLLIGFQVIRSLSQMATVEPEPKYYRPLTSSPAAMTDDIKRLIQHSSAPDRNLPKDSILFHNNP